MRYILATMPQTMQEDGIVSLSVDIDTAALKSAYRKGIFPWPIEDTPLIPWFCPPKRGILHFSELHIPRSLQKIQKKAPFQLTLDQAFDRVIEGCSQAHGPTWITSPLMAAYKNLHREGQAHSIEAWKDGTLVGGIYGVDAGGAFACESMFYLEPYASKLALLYLIDHLSHCGLSWIDIQMVTPHMEALGAREIRRTEFLKLLKKTQDLNLKLFNKYDNSSHEGLP